MSTLKPTRKISRRHELREDKVVTFYARALALIEDNRRNVLAGAGVVVIVIAAFIGFSLFQADRNATGADRMALAVQAWEAGDYRTALDGTSTWLGLEDVIDDFGSTQSGNLAVYYAADAHFQLAEYDRALELFRDFSKDANHLGAAAFAGEAAILEMRGEFSDAGDLYRRAASVFESEVTSPAYLLKAGRSYEEAGDRRDARQVYEQIRDEYPDSQEARDIEFFLSRVGGS